MLPIQTSSSSKGKKPLRPPNSPAVKESKKSSSALNGAKDVFNSSNRRGSLVTGDEASKSGGAKERLGIGPTAFGSRVGSVKATLGGGFNSKEPRRMSSRDNLSSGEGSKSLLSSSSSSASSASKRQSSFRAASNPPAKPKPPPAISKPTATNSSSKSNHLAAATPASITARISGKFGGGRGKRRSLQRQLLLILFKGIM